MNISNELNRLERACFEEPWSATMLELTLNDQNSVLVTEENDGGLVGFALGRILSGECELYRIAVLPSLRKHGVGIRLLQKFISRCFELGGTEVFLEVNSSNLPAINLYKKSGFQMVTSRKNYYGEEDAVIMQIKKEV